MTQAYPPSVWGDDGTPEGPGVPGRIARWLWEHGWSFEDNSWPATFNVKEWFSEQGKKQDDLTLTLEPTSWKVGVDWDYVPARTWDPHDIRTWNVQVGPLHLSYQRWRYRG